MTENQSRVRTWSRRIAFFLCRDFGTSVGLMPVVAPFEGTKNGLGLYRHRRASKYDDGIALGLAKVAVLTYKTESEFRSEIRTLGYQDANIHFIPKDNHVGVVIIDEETIVIAFRGTDDPGDWCTNFLFIPDLAEGVHSGFKNALDTLWKDMKSKIRGKTDGRAIFLTGHSLGGALATLAAVRLKEKGVRVASLYTFGQPPVGRKKFSKIAGDLSSRYFRFINNVDLVASMPTLFARHFGQVRYFNVLGQLYDRQPFRQSLIDSVAAPGIEAGAEWLSHGKERYVELLKSRQELQ